MAAAAAIALISEACVWLFQWLAISTKPTKRDTKELQKNAIDLSAAIASSKDAARTVGEDLDKIINATRELGALDEQTEMAITKQIRNHTDVVLHSPSMREQRARVLPNVTEQVKAVHVNGNLLLVTSHASDQRCDVARVLDDTGEEIVVIAEHFGAISDPSFDAVAMSPNGNLLLTGNRAIWNPKDPSQTPAGQLIHGYECSAITFNPDGTKAIYAEYESFMWKWQRVYLHVHEVNTDAVGYFGGGTPVTLDYHQVAYKDIKILCVAVSPDGQYLVSGDSSGFVCVAQLARVSNENSYTSRKHDKRIALVQPVRLKHTSCVNAVTVSRDSHVLVGTEGSTISMYSIQSMNFETSTGPKMRIFQGHTAAICCVTTTVDSKWAISGSDDGTLRVWRLADCTEMRTLTESSSPSTPHARPKKSWPKAGVAVPEVAGAGRDEDASKSVGTPKRAVALHKQNNMTSVLTFASRSLETKLIEYRLRQADFADSEPPGGFESGQRVFYVLPCNVTQQFNDGDELKYGMVGTVIGLASAQSCKGKDPAKFRDAIAVKFDSNLKAAGVAIPTYMLSRDKPPPLEDICLPGGFWVNERVRFTGTSAKFAAKEGVVTGFKGPMLVTVRFDELDAQYHPSNYTGGLASAIHFSKLKRI